MSPYAHHMSDQYLHAYRDEIGVELLNARNGPRLDLRIRRTLARGVVRLGAWILPETPEVVDGRIFVLSPTTRDELHEAA